MLVVEDNGIGMSRNEMIDALGTIARSGTKAFMERLEASKAGEKAELIGQFGVGFYSSFMVADKVDVISRRAGQEEAWMWSSDGKGSYDIVAIDSVEAPTRGTRVVLHLMEDAKRYTNKWTVEKIIRDQSGHVPVPIRLVDKETARANTRNSLQCMADPQIGEKIGYFPGGALEIRQRKNHLTRDF